MDVSDNKEEFGGTDSGELAGTDGITSFEARWMERFDELKEFKRINGHFNISRTNSEYPGLGRWIEKQRAAYRRSNISDDLLQRLIDIGFSLDGKRYDQLWEQRYNELKEFKSINGNCIVSETNADYPRLGRWVTRQRRAYKNNNITDDRVQRLSDIGFSLDGKRYDQLWEQRYNELKEFKSINGNCIVSETNADYPRLGRWVTRQ